METEVLSCEQILNFLEEKKVTWDDLGYGDVDWEELDLGKVDLVERYGGEGKGETYYKIYHFVDHNVYIQINGYYSSYNGAEFEDAPYEVKPVEKTITVYER